MIVQIDAVTLLLQWYWIVLMFIFISMHSRTVKPVLSRLLAINFILETKWLTLVRLALRSLCVLWRWYPLSMREATDADVDHLLLSQEDEG